MKRWFKILFIACIFNASATMAQVGLHPGHLAGFSQHSTTIHQPVFHLNHPVFTSGVFYKSISQSIPFNSNSAATFPKLYTYDDLAFFCKVEVKLEKAATFPVKFRLGDVNYVDQLEGK